MVKQAKSLPSSLQHTDKKKGGDQSGPSLYISKSASSYSTTSHLWVENRGMKAF